MSSILGWVVIIYLSIIILFCLIWSLPNSDKGNYRAYKAYESKIDKRLQQILDNINSNSNKYYSNEISKKKMISYLNKASSDLEDLYDSFKWEKGDEVTKELFVIKKQIIIKYAQIYKNKAMALYNGIASNELEETEYINILTDQYNLKNRLQREKYNLFFQK